MVTTKKLKMEGGQQETIVNDDEESSDANNKEGEEEGEDENASDDDHDSEDYDSEEEEEEDSDVELMQNLMNTIKETREENKRLTDTLIQISQDNKQQQEQTKSSTPSKEALFGKIMALAAANSPTAGTNDDATATGADATTKPPSSDPLDK
jgi:hypothetical protein